MRIFYLIYTIVSYVVAIGVLVCVAVDIILEKKQNKEIVEKEDIAPIIPDTAEDIPKPAMVMPEPIDEIDVESADKLISDELAMSAVIYEHGARKGARGIVNIDSIDAAFERGDIVSVDTLKEKGLIFPKVQRVKILARGVLHKPLIVKAEAFSVQAVKMIELTGGTVIVLQD